MRARELIGAGLAIGLLTACAGPMDGSERRLAAARLAEARAAAIQKDAQIATLSWYSTQVTNQLKIRELELSRIKQSEQYVKKLDEVMALNSELQKRVEAAEEALGALSALSSESTSEHLSPTLERQIQELRRLRAQSAERREAYEKLARSLQFLIDTGRLQLFKDGEGQVQVVAPRAIDSADPWM